ncbi:serine/threonine protein kinase, partial [bacterium]|nr:serine/threonine protein kinase [bacterium]MBU1025274.1 serine/threonine protein kinase [bacterium]
METKSTKIGPYEIIREIGRGGMGVVYLAKHPTLGINVALKAMYPDPSRQKDDPDLSAARERFIREAQITANLNDPHIVRVYDYGIDEKTGVLFIVMNYIDGGTLKDVLNSKTKLTLEETLKIVIPIAKTLQYLHSRGIV